MPKRPNTDYNSPSNHIEPRNVRARPRDVIVIEHSVYQLHIITDIPSDTVVSELTRLFLDVFADPN